MDTNKFSYNLPSVPNSLEQISGFFQAHDVDQGDLIEFLNTQPVLALHVLQLVNSPYYGVKNSVTSIKQAVMLLGPVIIRGIILAAVIKKSFPPDLRPYSLSLQEFETITIKRIDFLKQIVQSLTVDKDLLLSIAFLMEDGKLITSNVLQTEGLTEHFQEVVAGEGTQAAELKLLGLTSYEAMKILLLKWNFHPSFATLFTDIFEQKTLEAKLLYLGSKIISVGGVMTREEIKSLYPLIEECGIDKSLFLQAYENITKG